MKYAVKNVMKKGRVSWYDPRSQSGIIRLSGGPDIHFSCDDGRVVAPDVSQMNNEGRGGKIIFSHLPLQHEPCIGEEVVLWRERVSKKHIRAKVWGYRAEWKSSKIALTEYSTSRYIAQTMVEDGHLSVADADAYALWLLNSGLQDAMRSGR